MGIVVECVDLAVAGRANLNCGTGIETFAFRLLTRNQVVFSESGHLPMAKFAGLRHRLEISGWWGIVTRNLILAIARWYDATNRFGLPPTHSLQGFT